MSVAGDGLSFPVPSALVDAIADAVAARLSTVPAGAEPPEPAPADGKLAVSAAEAADLLGVSADHFRRRIAPDLRIIRSGRLRLVPVAELEAWVERNAARVLAGARLAHDLAGPHDKRDSGRAAGTDPGTEGEGRA